MALLFLRLTGGAGSTPNTTGRTSACRLGCWCPDVEGCWGPRSERLAKYNQLLRIEEELGSEATYAGESWRHIGW
jgi:enolase